MRQHRGEFALEAGIVERLRRYGADMMAFV
jgi:hypothetical protein